jgi:hypothetical protein
MTFTPCLDRADLLREFLGREARAGDDADAARFGDRGGERRERDAHGHAPLHDREAGCDGADRE